MGLLPSLTPLVYASNPANIAATITAARNIEVGYNFTTGPSIQTTTSNNATLTTAVPNPQSTSINNDVDELTKKLE